MFWYKKPPIDEEKLSLQIKAQVMEPVEDFTKRLEEDRIGIENRLSALETENQNIKGQLEGWSTFFVYIVKVVIAGVLLYVITTYVFPNVLKMTAKKPPTATLTTTKSY